MDGGEFAAPMLPDLTRPPAPIGPRRAGWVRWFIGMLVSFVAVIVFLNFLAQPTPDPSIRIVWLLMGMVAGVCFSYCTYRLGTGNSVARQALAARGGAFGDPERGRRRVADREEVQAYRRFRRGRISRIQYERTIAYRRFVHGELSKLEYHQVLDFLAFHEAHPARSGRPSPRAQ